MNINIPDSILKSIRSFAIKSNVEKIILFGSRARGTHSPRSDIDLAILGGDFYSFEQMIDEQDITLLMFDIINLNQKISDDLAQEIQRDGIIVYKKN
ncbi:MAG: nucleotidyltransferase domain-containing protein [Clostridiales bacterium]|nr:nucleotidyltransferase domain-containing protein [Clostridiales bacterium]